MITAPQIYAYTVFGQNNQDRTISTVVLKQPGIGIMEKPKIISGKVQNKLLVRA